MLTAQFYGTNRSVQLYGVLGDYVAAQTANVNVKTLQATLKRLAAAAGSKYDPQRTDGQSSWGTVIASLNAVADGATQINKAIAGVTSPIPGLSAIPGILQKVIDLVKKIRGLPGVSTWILDPSKAEKAWSAAIWLVNHPEVSSTEVSTGNSTVDAGISYLQSGAKATASAAKTVLNGIDEVGALLREHGPILATALNIAFLGGSGSDGGTTVVPSSDGGGGGFVIDVTGRTKPSTPTTTTSSPYPAGSVARWHKQKKLYYIYSPGMPGFGDFGVPEPIAKLPEKPIGVKDGSIIDEPFYTQIWFWGAIGGAAILGTGGYFLLRKK